MEKIQKPVDADKNWPAIMRYTPGPWYIRSMLPGQQHQIPTGLIAYVPSIKPGDTGGPVNAGIWCDKSIKIETGWADALLISKAPELITMLRRVMNLWTNNVLVLDQKAIVQNDTIISNDTTTIKESQVHDIYSDAMNLLSTLLQLEE